MRGGRWKEEGGRWKEEGGRWKVVGGRWGGEGGERNSRVRGERSMGVVRFWSFGFVGVCGGLWLTVGFQVRRVVGSCMHAQRSSTRHSHTATVTVTVAV